MTSIELVKAFQTELHQQDQRPVADTDDILYFLNKAQERFILDKFAGSRTSILGFEQSQDVIDDLRVFYEKDVLQDAQYAGATARYEDIEVDFAPVPTSYLHLVSARVEIHQSCTFHRGIRDDIIWNTESTLVDGETIVKRVADPYFDHEVVIHHPRVTQSDRVLQMLNDPFHTTIPHSPLSDINNNRLNVYTSTEFIVDAVIFNFIREPKPITITGQEPQTSELPEPLHRELVDRAVRLFLQFAS